MELINKKEDNGLSRREFIAMSGGAVGFATLVAMGVPAGWAENKSDVDLDTMNIKENKTDVLGYWWRNGRIIRSS